MNKPPVDAFSVYQNASVREVIEAIDRSARISLAVVIDDERRLITTITDGDVRRGVLAGVSLEASVKELLPIKARMPHPTPVTAPAGTDPVALLRLMQEAAVRQIPLVDADDRVVDVAILSELVPQQRLPIHAVIMAGGLGKRLSPLTDEMPKPMLPVGGRPLLELMIEKLRQSGILRITVATNFLREKIIDHFRDGHAFGVELDYITEAMPMGTAGAIGLMPAPPEELLLVVNGDILTQVDFRAMWSYHDDHKAEMTVAVRAYSLNVPYGVIECDGSDVRRLTEKPQYTVMVNAGIYLLEPAVFRHIPRNKASDMTDLIQWLLEKGRPVVSFPIMEYWLDIGQPADYERAQEDARHGRWKH